MVYQRCTRPMDRFAFGRQAIRRGGFAVTESSRLCSGHGRNRAPAGHASSKACVHTPPSLIISALGYTASAQLCAGLPSRTPPQVPAAIPCESIAPARLRGALSHAIARHCTSVGATPLASHSAGYLVLCLVSKEHRGG